MDYIVFDHFCNDYDGWYHTKTGRFVDEAETNAAFSLLLPQAGQAVLDVGCGTGNFSLKLAQAGCRVTAVDIAQNMLKLAQKKAVQQNATIQFHAMDAARLAFADGAFDAVLSMAAFEFMGDTAATYRELARVTKPGGPIVIGTIQKGGAWARLYESEACRGTAYEHAFFQTKEALIALAPANAAAVAECLFVPPGLPEEAYTMENEAQYRKKEEVGGFVCVKFQQPA